MEQKDKQGWFVISSNHLISASGMLNLGESALVLDHLEDPSGRTTHFLVQTRDGVKGWFAWKDSEFTGWNGNSCW